MKHSISLLALCVFAGVLTASAQGGPGQRRTVEERVKTTMEKITPELKLEGNQTALTDSAFANYYRGMDKLREEAMSGGGGARPDRTAFDKLTTERDEKLKKLFNAEQYKKFKDEVEPSMRPGRGAGGNRPQGGGRPTR